MSNETTVEVVKKPRVKKVQPLIRERKRRGKKSEEIKLASAKKLIMEEPRHFRVRFPEENDAVYQPEILQIVGASFNAKVPYNPTGSIPEDQVTFLMEYLVPKSDENLLTLGRFGKSHRFEFDSDLYVRAFSASSEGKLLEKMSYAERPSADFKVANITTKKGDKLLKFQPAGAEYLLRAKKCFLADEMGVGKTIQAIAGMATDGEYPWLFVVPANLRLNWLKEIKKWLWNKKSDGVKLSQAVCVLRNRDLQKKTVRGQVRIAPATKRFLAAHKIVIVNYDRVGKYSDYLSSVKWRGIVFDESHYLKGQNTQRARNVRSFIEKADPEYIWLLSGTPLMNRPTDLLAQLRIMGRLADFGGYNNFMRRYCTISTTDQSAVSRMAIKEKAKLSDSDATAETVEAEDPLVQQGINDAIVRKLYENMTALNKQLRATCYCRREKSEVLKDLPPKMRSTIPLPITNRKIYQQVEADVCNYLADLAIKDAKFLASIKKMPVEKQKKMIAEHRATTCYKKQRGEALVRLTTLKKTAAVGKMKAAIEWINDFVENGQKIVLFAHHHLILDELIDAFPEAAHTRRGDRDAAVERFQTDPKCRIFIGSLKRDGVGLTLTAASATAFLELGWTPAAHDQAEDRVHRIGQKSACTAYYLLAHGTIEEYIAKLIENKRQIVNAVADGDPLHHMEQGSIIDSLISALAKKEMEKKEGKAVSKKRKARKASASKSKKVVRTRK